MTAEYDCRPAEKIYDNLVVLCNGCGEPMRAMGEWPVQWPKAVEPKFMRQCFRYSCRTCKIPSEKYPPGVPVMATIVCRGAEHD